jgi:transmembrane sensor
VVASGSWVRAVGTAFNVYVRPADVQVTVSEGTVKVAGEQSDHDTPSDVALAQAAVSVLTAGEQADVRGRSAAISSLKPMELMRSVAWRRGSVYFENQSLGDVVDELSRYTTLRIEIGDDSLRRLHIGGSFQANPDGAEALLTMLRDGFGLTVRRDARGHAYIERQQAAR